MNVQGRNSTKKRVLTTQRNCSDKRNMVYNKYTRGTLGSERLPHSHPEDERSET